MVYHVKYREILLTGDFSRILDNQTSKVRDESITLVLTMFRYDIIIHLNAEKEKENHHTLNFQETYSLDINYLISNLIHILIVYNYK